MVDLIRDGAATGDLRARGDRAVWTALVRTASSAALRGWDCWEWIELVTDTASVLGQQTRRNSRGKARQPEAVEKLLSKAWDTATEWASAQPAAWDRDAAKVQARQRARGLMLIAADPDIEIVGTDRAVLAYAAEQATARGLDRIALPRRTVVEQTGLGERAVRNALRRLHEAGLLVLADPGRPSGPSARRARAALYRIATAETIASYLYRETRSVGPPAQVCGTPARDSNGTPTSSVGPPALRLVQQAS